MRASSITIVFTVLATSAFWYFLPLRYFEPTVQGSPDDPDAASSTIISSEPATKSSEEIIHNSSSNQSENAQADASAATARPAQSAVKIFDKDSIPGDTLLEKLNNSTSEPCICPAQSLVAEYLETQPGSRESKVAELVRHMVQTQAYTLYYTLKNDVPVEEITRLLLDNYDLALDEAAQQNFLSNLGSIIYDIQLQNPESDTLGQVSGFLREQIRDSSSSSLLAQLLNIYRSVSSAGEMQAVIDEILQTGSDQAVESVIANFFQAGSQMSFDQDVVQNIILPRVLKEIAEAGSASAWSASANASAVTGVADNQQTAYYNSSSAYPLLNSIAYSDMQEQAQRRILRTLQSNEPELNTYSSGETLQQTRAWGNWVDVSATLEAAVSGEFRSQLVYNKIMGEDDTLKRLVILHRASPEVIDKLKKNGALARILADGESLAGSLPPELKYLLAEPYQNTGYPQTYDYATPATAEQ